MSLSRAGRGVMPCSMTVIMVIAVRKQVDETHKFVFNPAADTRLDIDDDMIVLGQPDQVARLRDLAQA
jgi:uncharacterized protein with PhoU and TrkA domain